MESVARLPFFINSEFELDTGRRNLAACSEDNKELLDKISVNFAKILCDSKKNLLENNFEIILNLMVTTYNMQSEQLFKPFAENVLRIVYENSGIIPTGWGTIIDVQDDPKIFSIIPSNYGFDSENAKGLFSLVQQFLFKINKNYYVVTDGTADLLFKTSNIDISRKSLESLLPMVEKITPELLEHYCKIAHVVEHRKLFKLVDFSGRI